VVMLYLQMP